MPGRTPESGTPESGTTESGTPESGTPESGTPESGTTESGTTGPGTTEAIRVSRTGRMNRSDGLDNRRPLTHTQDNRDRTAMTADAAVLTVKSEDAFLRDEAHAMRAGVHELLARLLAREPDEEVLARLRGIGEVDTAEGPLAMGWELLRVAAERADVAALRREYNALFIGVGRGELVPFGSWYLTGFLMERPLAQLRADLRRFGIERPKGVPESEDHIAAVHDALALIIRSADEIGFDEQRDFFAAHVEPWAGRFHEDLQGASSADFYRAVGFFGASFLDVEREVLGTSDRDH